MCSTDGRNDADDIKEEDRGRAFRVRVHTSIGADTNCDSVVAAAAIRDTWATRRQCSGSTGTGGERVGHGDRDREGGGSRRRLQASRSWVMRQTCG